MGLFSGPRELHLMQDFVALVDSRSCLLFAREARRVVEVADDPPILEMQFRREIKFNRHAAETPGRSRRFPEGLSASEHFCANISEATADLLLSAMRAAPELNRIRVVPHQCADCSTDELFFSVPKPSKASSISSSSVWRTRHRRSRDWILFEARNRRRMCDQCPPTIFVPTEERPNG
jgi:hypothetical protein